MDEDPRRRAPSAPIRWPQRRELQHFQPAIHEQIERLFPDYQPDLFARALGLSRAKSLAQFEELTVGIAAAAQTPLNDDQVRATVEHQSERLAKLYTWRWACIGLGAYMTYRGRRTWRFPFFDPKPGGVIDPFNSSPPRQVLWHAARFVSYMAVLACFLDPIGSTCIHFASAMKTASDPRLAGIFTHDESRHPHTPSANRPTTTAHPHKPPAAQQTDPWRSDSQPDGTSQDPAAYDAPGAISARARPGWRSPRQPHQPQQQQQQHDSWDASPDDNANDDNYDDVDDVDDASPVSPSSPRARDDPASDRHDGSAWDRVRQQSQRQPAEGHRRQPREAWHASEDPGQGWGDRHDAEPRRRAPGDRRSLSGAEGDRAAKNQAQEEFDELLERERRGVDQGRGSGRGK